MVFRFAMLVVSQQKLTHFIYELRTLKSYQANKSEQVIYKSENDVWRMPEQVRNQNHKLFTKVKYYTYKPYQNMLFIFWSNFF